MLESLQPTFIAGFNIGQLAKPWRRAQSKQEKEKVWKEKENKRRRI